MIKCSKCGKEKPKTEFYPSNYTTKDGLPGKPSWCKECKIRTVKKWGKKHSVYKNSKERARRTGASFGIYAELHEKQSGLCAICGQPETAIHQSGTMRSLCADHDHKTGKLRGLLCSRCNAMLGFAKDNEQTLRHALLYLLRNK